MASKLTKILTADIEHGGALPEIARPQEVDDALREDGFEPIEARDLAAEAMPGIPWDQPLATSGLSAASCRSSVAGRRVSMVRFGYSKGSGSCRVARRRFRASWTWRRSPLPKPAASASSRRCIWSAPAGPNNAQQAGAA